MIFLTGDTDSIRIITTGTQPIDVHASWADLTNTTGNVTPGRTNTAITTATTTVVVASPAASVDDRVVKSLTVRNKHATQSNTVCICHFDGTVEIELLKVTLPAGFWIHYDENRGFQVFDNYGSTNLSVYDRVDKAILAGTQIINLVRFMGAAKGAGLMQSGWLAAPNPGIAPVAYNAGSGYTCDNTTTGAIPYTNASSGTNRIVGAQAGATQLCTVLLYDRLWSCSGMGFAAGTYTVTTPGSLPARVTDNGAGCEVFIENFIACGAATGTVTLNYVNAAGATVSAILQSISSGPVAGQLQRFPVLDGIRSVTSVVTSQTWTSGTFGITIARRLLSIPAAIANIMSFPLTKELTGLVAIPSNACLMIAIHATTTTGPTINGSAVVANVP
jgi:hypothetical protein